MNCVREHPDGATLAVKAMPGAKKNAVLGEVSGMMRVSVTAPPQDGRANDALIEVLHDWLGIKRSQITLLSGESNRHKVILISGFSVAELLARISSSECLNRQNR